MELSKHAGLESVAAPDEEFLQYIEGDSLESSIKALHDLERLVDEEGPFDGVMAFSQGAALAASLIVHKQRKDFHGQQVRPVFRCAIFFSGGIPHSVSGGKRRELSFESDGELIPIPTAHVWGANDTLFPTFGPVLSKLCINALRADFVHAGGHEIPGPKDQAAAVKATQIIKRAIERASLL